MRDFNLKQIRDAYERGENVTKFLREEGSKINSLESIELAYDLQAGSYVGGALKDLSGLLRRTKEMGEILRSHVSFMDVVIDCGAGELTTLSGMSGFMPENITLQAFDLSLSRLNVGLRFASRAMRSDLWAGLNVFVASMDGIPLPEGSVDIVMSSHALEPNFGRELVLLKEMLRVCRKKLVLFEPSFEDNTVEGKKRMIDLGYVRNLPEHIDASGGRLIEKFPLLNVTNPLNPTFCYVVEKIDARCAVNALEARFQCPVTGYALERRQGYLWSKGGGYAYPFINKIPLLRAKDAILMCHE